jgi:predicted Zn-dependent peptidase
MFSLFWTTLILQGDTSPTEFVLDNGMRVVMEKNDHIPQITMRLRYRFIPSETPIGVPHMVEHLMFEGSANVANGEYDRIIRSANGISNAQTGLDYILLETTLDKGALDALLFLESDRMNSLCEGIDEIDIENQKAVVAQEMWNNYLLRFGELPDRLRRGVFSTDPVLGSDVMGGVYDIEQIDKNMVCQFSRRWLQPQNASLVLVGDIDTKYASEKIEYWFSDIHSDTSADENQFLVEKIVVDYKQQNFFLKKSEESRVYLVWSAPALGTQDAILVDTVMELLVNPEIGYLSHFGFSEVSGWSENFVTGGWVVFEIGTDSPEQTISQVQQILSDVSLWATNDNLQLNENRNKALLQKMMQYNSSRADLLSSCQYFVEAKYCYNTELSYRTGVSVEDMYRVVETYYSWNNVSILYLGEQNKLNGEILP